MKKILTIFFIPFISCFSFSQNLVPNPGFELQSGCPDNLDQVYKAIGWSSFGQSPDYFHKCSTNPSVGIPSNFLGYQNTYSLNDSGYCALATYSQGIFGREFLGRQLISTLSSGVEYFVSFRVAAASNGSSSFQCFTNKIGAMFSTVPYSLANPVPVNNFAHIYTNSIITDSLNWIIISGSFISDSAYQYIIVGNFFDDINTDTASCSGSYAYYYIDDICISTDSNTCDLETGLLENNIKVQMNLFPNPTKETLTINISGQNIPNFEVVVYNSFGIEMKNQKCESRHNQINISELTSGIYFIKVTYTGHTIIQKFIKN